MYIFSKQTDGKTNRNQELPSSDCLSHELHGPRVCASCQDQRVRRPGSLDESPLERFFLLALHAEILCAADEREGEVRLPRFQKTPIIHEEFSYSLDVAPARDPNVPKVSKLARSPSIRSISKPNLIYHLEGFREPSSSLSKVTCPNASVGKSCTLVASLHLSVGTSAPPKGFL